MKLLLTGLLAGCLTLSAHAGNTFDWREFHESQADFWNRSWDHLQQQIEREREHEIWHHLRQCDEDEE